MRYKNYEITIDYISSICKRTKNGERRFVGGYLCRVFDKDDYFHEHLLDEFHITNDEISYNEYYAEVSKIIEYMDKNYME